MITDKGLSSVGSLGINGSDGGILLVVVFYNLLAIPQQLVRLDDEVR